MTARWVQRLRRDSGTTKNSNTIRVFTIPFRARFVQRCTKFKQASIFRLMRDLLFLLIFASLCSCPPPRLPPPFLPPPLCVRGNTQTKTGRLWRLGRCGFGRPRRDRICTAASRHRYSGRSQPPRISGKKINNGDRIRGRCTIMRGVGRYRTCSVRHLEALVRTQLQLRTNRRRSLSIFQPSS